MSISIDLRQQVRERAKGACEFCRVTEADCGGELTIDHYQPQSQGGNDTLENLIYSCSRCNLYKADYWSTTPEQLVLWNPRTETFATHFIESEQGQLFPLTAVGSFSLQRLRLNRPQLIQSRQNKRQHAKESELLQRYSELVETLNQLNLHMSHLLSEQQELLKEQRDLLKLLLKQ